MRTSAGEPAKGVVRLRADGGPAMTVVGTGEGLTPSMGESVIARAEPLANVTSVASPMRKNAAYTTTINRQRSASKAASPSSLTSARSSPSWQRRRASDTRAALAPNENERHSSGGGHGDAWEKSHVRCPTPRERQADTPPESGRGQRWCMRREWMLSRASGGHFMRFPEWSFLCNGDTHHRRDYYHLTLP
ncbi:hypothetical protein MTO96_017430 [Rhipicephalus appendiculatus]